MTTLSKAAFLVLQEVFFFYSYLWLDLSLELIQSAKIAKNKEKINLYWDEFLIKNSYGTNK